MSQKCEENGEVKQKSKKKVKIFGKKKKKKDPEEILIKQLQEKYESVSS